ncbi:zeta toxin family protein [Flavobacterium sp. T12S277]|uniref:zeta toxin family protein n=1 Tax=Flavobacterium sp. T12S277 TaxID=3402752 RepID=UPI003ADA3DE4
MKEKNLYIIAGCNGAGKTTASYTILPEILNCREFVNADEIARGLSPFQPEKVGFEAGRIMLHRINELLQKESDFAFETTLSAKSYISIIKKAQSQGYFVTLVFFWLNSIELAKQRVSIRVSEGGHNIPEDVIERRYTRGIKNFFKIYLNTCNNVMLFDNSNKSPVLVLEKEMNEKAIIIDENLFDKINNLQHD